MMASSTTTEAKVKDVYGGLASHYDRVSRLLLLAGFRDRAYRQMAVEALGLRPGDTVLELGCGTGQNLPLLTQAVGPQGRVIGIDLTVAMLDQAHARMRKAGWQNVELVHADAADYLPTAEVGGVLSTFALGFSPQCGNVIRRVATKLGAGRCCVILDQKPMNQPFHHLMPYMRAMLKSFALDDAFFDRKPWQDITNAMQECLEDVDIRERYLGYVYMIRGKRPAGGTATVG